uniref:Copia protein n=1 Tax=Tanacetum cinerariifolium TaxID=118510 RepID=A0A6L2L9B2_TANCI|nr:copia protein [Tanacetum cinerariifolium]
MAGSENESGDTSVHSEASNAQQQPNIQPQIITTVSNNNAKFPYLKKDEYEVWAIKMEYWIINNDMNIWKVIQNGNSLKRTGRDRDGKSTPDDHVADFHYMDDAKDIWNAVKARFGGIAESKKIRKSMLKQEFLEFRIGEAEGLHKGYRRMQKILSQLNQLKAKPEDEDINLKFLRALHSSCSHVALTLKTKGGLELLSFDDLYYKFKTFEKAGRKIEFDKKESARFNKKKVRCYKCQQRGHFAEECRAKGGNDKQRYSSFKIKEIGKKEEDSKALITVDTLVDWTDHDGESNGVIASKEFGMIAGCDTEDEIEEGAAKIYNLITRADTEEASTASDAGEFALIGVTSKVHNCPFGCDNKYNELQKQYNELNEQNSKYFIQVQAYKNSLKTLEKQKRVLQRTQLTLEDKIMVLSIELENTSNLLKHFERINADVETAKTELQTKLDNHLLGWDDSAFSIFTTNSEDVEGRPLFNRFAKADSMKAMPPPLSGDYISLSDHIDLDKSQMFYRTKSSTSSDFKSVSNDIVSSDDSDKSLEVNTNDFASSDSSVKSSEPKPNDSTSCASTFSVSTSENESEIESNENPFPDAEDKGVFDSGCSRSMTGNKERLDDFQVFQGGKVTFGGGEGKQHKASYKAINAVSSISEPLQMLHMELLGPTSIRSIDHKYYCLVITDDYSRKLVEKKVKTMRCDNGTEFKNAHIIELCGSKGIKREYSNARTPQQNRVAERKNRTLIEAARTMSADSKVEETMNLRFLEEKPNVHGLGHEWYFDLNYLTDTLGYKHVYANQSTGTQEAITNHTGTQDADLDSDCDEQVIIIPSYPSYSIQGTEPKDTSGDEVDDSPFDSVDKIFQKALARLKGQEQGATSDAERLGLVPTGNISVPTGDTMVSLDDVPVHTSSTTDSFFNDEPTTRFPSPSDLGNHDPSPGIFSSSSYDDESGAALNNVASTVEEEMQQFKFQNIWVLADLPKGKYAIGTKWILKNKRDARGIVVRNKARLVAQGHKQEEGIDYDEVFAPVARIKAIRLFLAFASYMGFMVYEIDVRSAFLYERIDKEGEFQMSAMGELTFFLGLQVQQRPDETFINLDKCVQEILNKFDLGSVRMATTPYEAPKPKSKNESDSPVNEHLYRSMIGLLMYLIASRPDIIFAVSACLRNQVTPTTSNLEEMKKIFKYLKGQPKLGLWYPRESRLVLEAYSDSDYAGVNKDRKSTTGGSQNLNPSSTSSMAALQYMDKHNKVGYLLKPIGSDDYHQIIDFLRSSHIRSPELGPPAIQATIDATPYTITEDLVRSQLQLADDGGIDDLPIAEIYYGMDDLGPLAIALICLSDGRQFNWSSYIFKGMPMGGRFELGKVEKVVESDWRGGGVVRSGGKWCYKGWREKGVRDEQCNFLKRGGKKMGYCFGVAAQAVPQHMPAPNQPQDHLSTPPRQQTSDLNALVFKHGQCSDANIASFSRTHEIDADPFTNVEDKPLGGSFYMSPPRSTQAPPAGQTSGSVKDLITLTALSSVDVVGKLVKKVKAIEVKLKTTKRKMVVSDSNQEERGKKDVDLDALLALVNEVVTVDSNISPGGASHNPAASTSLPAEVPTSANVPTGSTSVPADVPTSVAPAGVSTKEKLQWWKKTLLSKKGHLSRYKRIDLMSRLQRVLALTMYYTEADWINIMAQVEANASLSKTLLGDDVSKDNFPVRMAALIKRKKQALAEKLAKERRNRPMTQGQQRTYMRNLSRIRVLLFILLDRIQAFSRTLKRTGPVLEESSSKRQKSTEAFIPSVPEVPYSPVVSLPKSSGTRRKSLSRKHLTKTKSKLTKLDLDADAQIFIKVVSNEDSDDEAPLLWFNLIGWEVITTPLGDINALYIIDRSTKHFTTLRQILYMVDRHDLVKLYGLVVKYYENHHVNQHLWQIRSWRLYTISNVHVLETVSGEVVYMFVDISYPFSVKLMKRMLKHKLEIDKDVVGNDITTAEQLIQFIKNQLAAAQVSPA